jgi:hypothetical protein
MRRFIEAVVGEAIALLQLGSAGGMAFAVTNAEVLADEGAVAIGEITAKDLFRGICKKASARGRLALRRKPSTVSGLSPQRSIAYGSTDAGTSVRRANNSFHIPRVCIRICDRRELADCVAGAWRAVRRSRP